VVKRKREGGNPVITCYALFAYFKACLKKKRRGKNSKKCDIKKREEGIANKILGMVFSY